MTTLSFKRTMSLLIGLCLVLSLICISAAGQGSIYRKRHKRARMAAAAGMVTNPPTLETPYFCSYTIHGSETRYSTVIMTYSRNMPQNGFLGHIHTVLFPNGQVLDKDMQVYNARPAQGDGSIPWSFQNQDGSVVCKEMLVSADKRKVTFSQCSNTAVQTCNAL
jgi:hypothetical protein